jgi:hypothetical protein
MTKLILNKSKICVEFMTWFYRQQSNNKNLHKINNYSIKYLINSYVNFIKCVS